MHVCPMSITSAQQFGRQFYNKIPVEESKKRDVFVIAIEGYVQDKSFYSTSLCSKLNRSGINTVDLNMQSGPLSLNRHEGIPITMLSLIYEAYSIRKEHRKYSAMIVPNLPEDLLTISPKCRRPLETAIKLMRHTINPSMVVYLDSPTGNSAQMVASQYDNSNVLSYTPSRAAWAKNILLESYSNVFTINTSKPKEEVVTQMCDWVVMLLRQ